MNVLPRLSIVVPSHNRPDLLRLCLASVQRHAPGTEVVVVDDASPGGVVAETARAFEEVRVVRRARQGGFCAAVNDGIRATRGEVVELLNDDTEVCSGWAEPALAAFANPTVGAVAPLVLCWPGGDMGTARIDSAGDRYHLGGIAGKRGHGERLGPEHLRSRFVFGASGSSAFYRREVLLNLGGFPESFGAYFEDVDLSFRLHWAGWRVWFEPCSQVLHRVSASYGSRPSPSLLEQQSRNEELVFWRNIPDHDLLRAVPLHLVILLGKAWRRWHQGELLPFLRGRLQAFRQLPALRQHCRRLGKTGPRPNLRDWEVEKGLG
jgi:GT2 family glycosyltransferase